VVAGDLLGLVEALVVVIASIVLVGRYEGPVLASSRTILGNITVLLLSIRVKGLGQASTIVTDVIASCLPATVLSSTVLES